MAERSADRVRETTTTTGTGTIDLAGAVSTFRTLVAGHATGETVRYCIVHQSANEWEVGYGVLTDASPDTLSRLVVQASSNSGNLVSFSAGTKDVFTVADTSLVRGLIQFAGPMFPRLPANAKSDFFNDSKGMSGPVNGLSSIWTAVNQGSQTIAYADGCAYIAATAADSKFLLVQAVPATPYTVTLRIKPYFFNTGQDSNVGIVFRETGTGKLHTLIFTGGLSPQIDLAQYSGTGSGTFVASDFTYTVQLPSYELVLRVTDNGTNFVCDWSPDGGIFKNMNAGVGRTSYLGAVNTFGIIMNGVSAAQTAGVGPFIVS